MVPRTKEHNERIAASVRSKWLDPEYRKRTSAAMRKAAQDRIIANGGVPKPPRVRRPRVPRAPGEPRARASRLEGVGISREAQRNLNKWARQRKDAEVRGWAWRRVSDCCTCCFAIVVWLVLVFALPAFGLSGIGFRALRGSWPVIVERPVG